jgi:DNA-binding transcriptional ArsR family regulator
MANISVLDALGDPTRRRLLERLRQGSCSVAELISIVPISQPAVSQHLRVLREARLVRVEKRGQQRIYHLDPAGLAELRGYVEGLWEDVLRAFGEQAERITSSEENARRPAKHKKTPKRQKKKVESQKER